MRNVEPLSENAGDRPVLPWRVVAGALRYLQQHYRYRPSADRRLLVDPYRHTAMQTGVVPTVDGYDVDRAAMIDLPIDRRPRRTGTIPSFDVLRQIGHFPPHDVESA